MSTMKFQLDIHRRWLLQLRLLKLVRRRKQMLPVPSN
jgi:hypothetical protein